MIKLHLESRKIAEISEFNAQIAFGIAKKLPKLQNLVITLHLESREIAKIAKLNEGIEFEKIKIEFGFDFCRFGTF